MKYTPTQHPGLHLLLIGLLTTPAAIAGPVTIPHSFSSGTPAVAAEVNNNFNALKKAVDDNDARISSNNTAATTNTNSISQMQTAIRSNLCSGLSFIQGFDQNNVPICSTSLSGTDYARKLPVYQDNLTTLEIAGVTVNKPVSIVSGLGIGIERIQQFTANGVSYSPGLNTEDDFVIDVVLADEPDLKARFDAAPSIVEMAVIVKNLAGNEVFRYNIFDFIPNGYVDLGNGLSRFTFSNSLSNDNALSIQSGSTTEIFGGQAANNPQTDTLTEISGVITNFYPAVTDDTANQILTMEYDSNEGAGIYDWFVQTATGVGTLQSVTLIQQANGVEVSRTEYFDAFPIRWEVYDGFSLPEKIKARVVISYSSSQQI